MHPDQYEVVKMPQAELDALPEYSISEPTATTIGKRWKRGLPCGCWLLCEYLEHTDPRKVLVRSRKIVVVEQPSAPAAEKKGE